MWIEGFYWEITKSEEGGWISVCEELRLTIETDLYEHIIEDITEILSYEELVETLVNEALSKRVPIPAHIISLVQEHPHEPGAKPESESESWTYVRDDDGFFGLG